LKQQEALQRLSTETTKEGSGTTSLGALFKAKMDQNNG
jgi:small subunit ribosomal protein S1